MSGLLMWVLIAAIVLLAAVWYILCGENEATADDVADDD